MDSSSLADIAKVVGVTSAGVFAGYTWALSHAAVPAAMGLDVPEAIVVAVWRTFYLKGFMVSIPATLLNATSFTYLAYTSPPRSFQQALYLTALLTTSSGIPWAWTFLRPTNGALAIRAKKLAGAGEWPDAPALTYALHLESARGLERRESTRGLVKRWKWINEVRTAVLVLGTVLGVAGMCVV